MSDQNMVQKAKRLKELKAIEDQVSKELELLKAEFKTHLGEPGAYTFGEVTVMLTEKTRQSLDKKGLIVAFGAEVIDKYTTETEFLELRVS